MLSRLLLVSVLGFVLTGCGTLPFNPQVFALAETKIADFPVTGNVAVNNLQDSKTPTIVHSYGGTKLESNYFDLTRVMVEQTKSELARHGKPAKPGKEKLIGLKITQLNSDYIAFYWKSTMTFTVTLGSGESFPIAINHGTGGGVAQDLNGAVADGVVALFKHEKVLKYLAE